MTIYSYIYFVLTIANSGSASASTKSTLPPKPPTELGIEPSSFAMIGDDINASESNGPGGIVTK